MKANKPVAWVTGAGGLIGAALLRRAEESAPGFEVTGLTREQVDLTDFAAVRALFHKTRPGLVIHCAALSRSPDCQANPTLARLVNIQVTTLLAELAAESDFIFFSTDLVFDGAKGNYHESDAPNPLSVYAETKVAAERIVLQNPRHAVLRTSLNGGVSPKTHNAFNEELRRAWQAEKVTRLFTDEYRCPIMASVTARAAWELAAQKIGGIYHLAGAERLSRFQIGQLAARRHPELNPRIEAGSLRDYQGPPRPPDCSLNVSKIQRLLSFPLPGLSRWIEENPAVDF